MAFVKKLTSWSASRYADYRQCPAKAKFKHVDKLKEPPNDAMARGIKIHELAEHYVKGNLKRFPSELSKFESAFRKWKDQYKKQPVSAPTMLVEGGWNFRSDWSITRFDDWKECWLRIKVDLAIFETLEHLRVVDHKTGKKRPFMQEEYMLQLELYALGAFHMYPHVETVSPELWYLDTGETVTREEGPYTRKDLPMLQKTWEKRVKAMMNDTKFKATPNSKCCWCHYRKENGGPCNF